jgi:predicted ATPase with chaperone activity
MTIVGLSDAAVQGARAGAVGDQELVLLFPHKRVLVKMAPADVCKERPEYDLSIAAGMLVMTTGRSWRC